MTDTAGTAEDWTALSNPQTQVSATTPRGFTGHEMLDGVGLVHMGGRVYEPELGRFLTADPVVQDATNTQALNRYSYVLNNPLSYTDPSGFFFKSIARAFKNFASGVFRSIVSGLKTSVKDIFSISNLRVLGGIAVCGNPYAIYTCPTYQATVTLASGGSLGDALLAAAVSTASAYNANGQATTGDNTNSLNFGILESSGAECTGDCPTGPPSWLDNVIRIARAANSIKGLADDFKKFFNGTSSQSYSNMFIPGSSAGSGMAMMNIYDFPEAPEHMPSDFELEFNEDVLTGAEIFFGGLVLAVDLANSPISPGPDVTLLVLASWQGTKVVRPAARGVTDFLSNTTIVQKGQVIAKGVVVDLRATIKGIRSGQLKPTRIFENREGLLPPRKLGYYKEYVHPTPGFVRNVGPQRIVKGARGELYYTSDHYMTFTRLN